MQFLQTIFGVLILYLILILIVARMVLPFLGFRKYHPPKEIPPEVLQTILDLEAQSHDQRSYLEGVYKFVQSRWHSARFKTVTELPLAFRKDLSLLWRQPGYAHCHTINYVFYTLLARSKYFTPDDIRFRHKLFNFMIHQYLRVRVNGKWLDVDPSLVFLKFGIGSHAGFFG